MVTKDRARQDWFMSTQRRDGCSDLLTGNGRRSTRRSSRVAFGDDRAHRTEQANADPPRWIFPAHAFNTMVCPALLPVITAPSTLPQDHRNKQYVRSFCPSSPPLRQGAAHRPSFNCLIGYPLIFSPAVFARLHPTLPLVPAARPVSSATKTRRRGPECGGRCRTERYDGKGNLHLQHAA